MNSKTTIKMDTKGNAGNHHAVVSQSVHDNHCNSCHSSIFCSQLLCEVETETKTACPFTKCECGAVLHTCKLNEHLTEICDNYHVPCINAQYGCPERMRRSMISKHLEVCPASVVICMAEWYRMPAFLDKNSCVATNNFRHYEHSNNKNPKWTFDHVCQTSGRKGQLDYDLMKRDSKLINTLYDSLAGRRLKKKLEVRTCFGKKHHPTLPLLFSQHHDVSERSGEIEDSHESEGNGRRDSNYKVYGNELNYLRMQEKQEARWQADLDSRIGDKKRIPRYWEFPDLERGDIHKAHCAYCYTINCDLESDYLNSCAMTDCRFNCGMRFHICKESEHKLICPLYSEVDHLASLNCYDYWTNNMFTSKEHQNNKSPWRFDIRRKNKTNNNSKTNKLNITPSSKLATFSMRRVNVFPDPPTFNDTVLDSLSLHFESSTRMSEKSSAIYTFVCGETLRRDEFATHYSDVHSVIADGIAGNWLELKCPMAWMGCSFSTLKARPRGRILKFCSEDGAFSTVPRSHMECTLSLTIESSSSRLGYFSWLPFTVMCDHILPLLDTNSLNKLCEASATLKNLISNNTPELFMSKGCVQLAWKSDEKFPGRWTENGFHWSFSKSMDKLDNIWDYVSGANEELNRHFQSECPFNATVEYDTTSKVGFMASETLMKQLCNVVEMRHNKKR